MSWLSDWWNNSVKQGKENLNDAWDIFNLDFGKIEWNLNPIDYSGMFPDQAKESRRKIVAGLTLSSDPKIAAIQSKAQKEYIETGKWNPKYTDEANAIRNPLGLSSGSGLMIAAGVALIVLVMRR